MVNLLYAKFCSFSHQCLFSSSFVVKLRKSSENACARPSQLMLFVGILDSTLDAGKGSLIIFSLKRKSHEIRTPLQLTLLEEFGLYNEILPSWSYLDIPNCHMIDVIALL